MKRLPKIVSDEAAEAFVARADLTKYDLSDMRVVRFEFSKDQATPAVDPIKANLKRAIPAKKAFAAVRVHHAAKMKAAKQKADKQK